MALQRIALTGGSYDARATSVAAQRCLNLYGEPIPQGDGEPIQFAYYPAPGLGSFAQLSGTIRCLYQTTQGQLIAVAGSLVVTLSATDQVTAIGSISAGATPVRMSDNGTCLFIVDGTNGWYCAMPQKLEGAYGRITQLSDPAWYGSPVIDILDTFFLFINAGTANWFTSPAQFADEKTTPFDSLYVASDSTSLSTIMSLCVVGQTIWLFGRWQTELWYDSGAADFPFQRTASITIESGAVSPYAVARIPTTGTTPNGGVMWLGQDRSGTARVYLGQLQQAAPVSTFPVEGALQDMGDLSHAVASVYQQEGHVFFVLTIPGQSSTWVYDLSSNLWHERCSLDADGNESQYRPYCWAAAYGKVFAGDYENGIIYQVDLNIPTDNGQPIKRQRSFPHLLTNGARAIHRQFMLDMQNGNGQTVSVDWSDDRGASFCSPQALALGTTGNVWPSLWRLGLARDRVYRVTWTASGGTALIGAFLSVEPVGS
ncbi:hypothetical protein [Neokomagataea anthophila]|uniref:Bacteriophage P22, Gp10, DNA-stabilising n=1 Tax=Neokomagataea anthophila TaxID=2826925 RepID=A0ABS5E823_9PROT|nr:hypothetical protein [Neokomagataea anthophila]MBR0560053.1 hypothetical protein [Neokomagataea anthophila]